MAQYLKDEELKSGAADRLAQAIATGIERWEHQKSNVAGEPESGAFTPNDYQYLLFRHPRLEMFNEKQTPQFKQALQSSKVDGHVQMAVALNRYSQPRNGGTS